MAAAMATATLAMSLAVPRQTTCQQPHPASQGPCGQQGSSLHHGWLPAGHLEQLNSRTPVVWVPATAAASVCHSMPQHVHHKQTDATIHSRTPVLPLCTAA
jgi:hypothetical protein